jgi:uncharacterized protein
MDVDEARRQLQRREDAREARGAARAASFRDKLPEAARLLRERGAGRVVLFGSLAAGEPGPTSDVDLAVEGLPGIEYFPALADLMGLFVAPVDLVRLEQAPPSLRERIEAEGVPL